MARYVYKRDAVPVGELIKLEAQFTDSAGNSKDADFFPTVEITDSSSIEVRVASASQVFRTSVGNYRLEFTVPDGYDTGLWTDLWVGTIDGYQISNAFDFTVNSLGTIEASGASVPDKIYTLDDDDLDPVFSQEEIKGILRLRRMLKARLRSVAFKPDGSSCPRISNDILTEALWASLAELNATPVFTSYTFADQNIQTLASDLITQGAMLIAWSAQSVIEAGNEFTVNDNGVTVNPPPVSQAINTQYSAQMSDYRAKLKEFKRNHRPRAIGISMGGSFSNIAYRRFRHSRAFY